MRITDAEAHKLLELRITRHISSKNFSIVFFFFFFFRHSSSYKS